LVNIAEAVSTVPIRTRPNNGTFDTRVWRADEESRTLNVRGRRNFRSKDEYL
jgi:hypothetical protein